MIWGGIIRLQLYILYVSKAIYLTEIDDLPLISRVFHKQYDQKKKKKTQVSGKKRQI